MQESQPLQGALLLGVSALLFALMGVAIRYATQSGINNEIVVFSRNLVGVIFFLPLLLRKGLAPLKTTRLKSHFLRTFSGLAAMYCFFYAIAHLPLADAMLFTYSAPIFTPIIAYFWLKEPLTPRVLVFSAIGLLGVALVAKPSNSLFNSLSLIGLAASLLAAIAYVSIRQMSDTEPAYRIVFYFAFFSALVSAVPLTWAWQTLTHAQLLWLGLAGLLAAFAQITMSRAYTLAPPSIISPIAYSAIIFAGLLAWFFWQETPDPLSIGGAVLIISASLMSLFLRKR